ncbi:hypothetical protein FSP39_003630 [Pinctada imbricata]|uniref:Uncharacterized protein n=1 Tax=Pinctada imbricata TaxID=66713 RepID=A0AA88Y6I6_PINIB|nr:hypothetical protein FSP39_003630 [Pinctada imbricata]
MRRMWITWPSLILLAIYNIIPTEAIPSYVVTIPPVLRPGENLVIHVDLFNTNSSVNVEVELRAGKSAILKKQETFQAGKMVSKDISLKIPYKRNMAIFNVLVSGSGGIRFNAYGPVQFSQSVMIFIQTDRAMYAENEDVKSRVLVFRPDLRPFLGALTLEAYNGENKLVRQWKDVSPAQGVYEKEFNIGVEPSTGTWKLIAIVKAKFTRKRSELDLAMGEFFPGEGSKYLIHEVANLSTTDVFFIGGSRRGEDSLWGDSEKLTKISFESTDDDVYISSISPVAIKGSKIPPLSCPGFAWGKEEPADMLIWGGLDINTYSVINDLYHISKKDNRKSILLYDVTKYAGAVKYAFHETNAQINPPSPRAAHSFNKIPKTNTFIMYGGYEMKQRQLDSIAFANPFTQSCCDGYFYKFDLDTYEWFKLNIPQITPRCFHTADFVSDTRMAIIGGVSYEGNVPKYRHAVHEVLMLNMDNLQIFNIQFEMSPQFVSFHASCISEDFLYILGGFAQNQSIINADQEHLRSRSLLKFNFKENTVLQFDADEGYESSGGSIIPVDSETLIITCGSSRQYFAFTTKPFVPSPCDLIKQNKCMIMDSPEISPIQWIMCEGNCKEWHHFFCSGLKNIPKGKYVCKSCSTSTRKGKKQ